MILGITCIQLGYSSWNIIFIPYLRFKRYAFIWFYLMPEVCGSLRWQVWWQVRRRWQFKVAVVINSTCVNTPYSSATIWDAHPTRSPSCKVNIFQQLHVQSTSWRHNSRVSSLFFKRTAAVCDTMCYFNYWRSCGELLLVQWGGPKWPA